jgi:hypothetical protein
MPRRCYRQSIRIMVISLVLLLALPSIVSAADVADADANGFTVKISVDIGATPAEVFRQILNIGDWWNPDHTYSGDAHNLSLEDRVGGCLCEKLPNQGGVRHMEVIFLAPGKALRLAGALGPLQALGANGTLSFGLSPSSTGTKLDVTYAVSGYVARGMNTFATPVDATLSDQINRLKNYVETGSPTAAQARPKSQ